MTISRLGESRSRWLFPGLSAQLFIRWWRRWRKILACRSSPTTSLKQGIITALTTSAWRGWEFRHSASMRERFLKDTILRGVKRRSATTLTTAITSPRMNIALRWTLPPMPSWRSLVLYWAGKLQISPLWQAGRRAMNLRKLATWESKNKGRTSKVLASIDGADSNVTEAVHLG